MTDLSARQSAANRQGKEWEDRCAVELRFMGLPVLRRHWRDPLSRIEIDIVSEDPDGEIWLECCGSYESKRNGLERTDSCLKKIANAYVLSRFPKRARYWLWVSHLPKPGTDGEVWLDAARELFDWVEQPPRPPRV